MSKETKPLLSVRFMVYNNEPYIRDAVEGILMQKTDFLVEIVVGDDFSTDKTLEIIKEYADTDKIRFNILERQIGDSYWGKRQKLGRLYNFENIIDNCTGKYIALLDGDDYWTDPLKLQKQVDFLETNEAYSYCGHSTYNLRNNTLEKNIIDSKEVTFESLIFKNIINSVSLVFRSSSILLPDFFTSSVAGDWAIQLIALKDNKGYILGDLMAVYRVHDSSIWNSLTTKEMCMRGVDLQEQIKLFYTDNKSHRIINKAIKDRKLKFGVIKPSFFKRVLKKTKKWIHRLVGH